MNEVVPEMGADEMNVTVPEVASADDAIEDLSGISSSQAQVLAEKVDSGKIRILLKSTGIASRIAARPEDSAIGEGIPKATEYVEPRTVDSDCKRFQPNIVYTRRTKKSTIVGTDGALKSDGDKCEESKIMPSILSVITDPITGLFMDDAMVALCGHSYGGSGLQQVMKTGVCMVCECSVPVDSLVPNLALRAAVDAYKKDGKSWQQTVNPITSEYALQQKDGTIIEQNHPSDKRSRPRGSENPFSVNDRVLVKGNKRTSERHFGRRAVITSQGLNGWWLVKMLDNGEILRLQYSSLEKLQENSACENDTMCQNGDSMGSDADHAIKPVYIPKSDSQTSEEMVIDEDRVLPIDKRSRSRGPDFLLSINDKVLIKGNKRVPERFYGRQATVTCEGLNGWFVVKMLDDGETLNLQYRSLEKLQDENLDVGNKRIDALNETLQDENPVVEHENNDDTMHGSIDDPLCKDDAPCHDGDSHQNVDLADGTEQVHITKSDAFSQSSEEMVIDDEGRHSKRRSRFRGPEVSFSVNDKVLVKGNKRIREKFFGRKAIITAECRNGWFLVKMLDSGESLRLQYRSLQKLLDAESAMEPAIDTTTEGTLHATSPGGSNIPSEDVQHGVACENGGYVHVSNADQHSLSSEEMVIDERNEGSQSSLKIVHRQFKALADIVENGPTDVRGQRGSRRDRAREDSVGLKTRRRPGGTRAGSNEHPYRKIYNSRSRTRGGLKDEQMPMLVDNADNMTDSEHLSGHSSGHNDDIGCFQANTDNSNIHDISSLLSMMKDEMLSLEQKIALKFLKCPWNGQTIWQNNVKQSNTIKELGLRVRELKLYSTFCTANGLFDSKWEESLATAINSTDVNLLITLWRNFNQQMQNVLDLGGATKELRDRNSQDGCGGRLSPVSVIAAADAVIEGQNDTDAILEEPCKFIKKCSREELASIREAFEREKHSVLAKLSQLGGNTNLCRNYSGGLEDGLHTTKQSSAHPSEKMGSDEANGGTCVGLLDADEEATDMSDSD